MPRLSTVCNSVVSVSSDIFGNIVTVQKNVPIFYTAGLQSLTFHLSPVCSITMHILVTPNMDFITNGADVYKYAALGVYRYHQFCSILVTKASLSLNDRSSEQKVDFFSCSTAEWREKGTTVTTDPCVSTILYAPLAYADLEVEWKWWTLPWEGQTKHRLFQRSKFVELRMLRRVLNVTCGHVAAV